MADIQISGAASQQRMPRCDEIFANRCRPATRFAIETYQQVLQTMAR